MGEFATNLSKSREKVIVFADRTRSREAFKSTTFEIRHFGGLKPIRRWAKARAINKEMLKNHEGVNLLIADSWKSLENLCTNYPTVVLAHGNELLVDKGTSRQRRITAAFNKADLILANSYFSADKVERLGISKARIRVFNPPAEHQAEPDQSSIEQVLALLAGNAPLILTVARLEPRKGIDRVIESLPELIRKHPRIIYIIGGDGTDRERLEFITRKYGVERHVCFLGRIDISIRNALLDKTSVFVMPTRNEGRSVEGFGISYIEAAWFGVPSIASSIGGGGDAVLDGKTGIVIKDTDVATVSAAIDSLLSDEDKRRKMGSAAARRAREELLWENKISVLEEYLDEARVLFLTHSRNKKFE